MSFWLLGFRIKLRLSFAWGVTFLVYVYLGFWDLTGVDNWVATIVFTSLLYLQVLLHELGHALVARRGGLKVRYITLSVLGGGTSVAYDPFGWRAELPTLAAGPLVSIFFSLVLFGVSLVLVGPEVVVDPLRSLVGVSAEIVGLNLIPVYPLDGGRLAFAYLMYRFRDSTVAEARMREIGFITSATTGILAVGCFVRGSITLGFFLFLGMLFAIFLSPRIFRASLTQPDPEEIDQEMGLWVS